MRKKIDYRSIILLGILILVEQIIKFAVVRYCPEIVSINKGILFGFISNFYIVGLLLVAGSIVLGYLIVKSQKIDLSLILILAGALSNIIDRFVYKGVVDYLNISFWTNFNLADVFIVAGVLIYIYKLIFIARYK